MSLLPFDCCSIVRRFRSEGFDGAQLSRIEVEEPLAGKRLHLLAGDLYGNGPAIGEDLQLGKWMLDVR